LPFLHTHAIFYFMVSTLIMHACKVLSSFVLYFCFASCLGIDLSFFFLLIHIPLHLDDISILFSSTTLLEEIFIHLFIILALVWVSSIVLFSSMPNQCSANVLCIPSYGSSTCIEVFAHTILCKNKIIK
jgi:hypothetical protein